jgi:caspase 7
MTSKDENQTNPSKYDMDHEKRGIALIINISKYDEPNPFELEEREWSIKDVENLTKTLNHLEFNVKLNKRGKIEENLTKSEIEEHLKQISTEIDHKDFDCFLCVVMSHGNEDNIVTRDNKLISFEEIMAPIKSCPSLFDKPKMFFFQACRGEKEMESRANSANSTKSSRGAQPDDGSSNLQSNIKKKTIFENECDLLKYFSTLPNHLSFPYSNYEENGTIFIKSVCDAFNNAYNDLPKNMSLAQICTKINESVSKSGQQISEIVTNRMNKEIYFLPKDVSKYFNL